MMKPSIPSQLQMELKLALWEISRANHRVHLLCRPQLRAVHLRFFLAAPRHMDQATCSRLRRVACPAHLHRLTQLMSQMCPRPWLRACVRRLALRVNQALRRHLNHPASPAHLRRVLRQLTLRVNPARHRRLARRRRQVASQARCRHLNRAESPVPRRRFSLVASPARLHRWCHLVNPAWDRRCGRATYPAMFRATCRRQSHLWNRPRSLLLNRRMCHQSSHP